MKQRLVIKVTEREAGKPILVGTESIIHVEQVTIKPSKGGQYVTTKISSRAAMVTSCYVNETVEEIYALINY